MVTPNYNMAEYLEETIQSVLRNLAPGDEYYVIDGGSTDGSVDIIRRYESQLSGWVSEPDGGYADALAKGFDMSTAPLMCWINCSDLLLEGSLDMRRAALAREGCDFVFGDDYYIDEQGYVLQQSNGQVRDLAYMMLLGGWTPLQDACAWRRTLYDDCGGLNRSISYAADYDLFLRMSRSGRACYLPAVLSAFRRHHSQISICGASIYEAERRHIRCRMMKDLVGFKGSSLGHRLWYSIIVQLRARIPSWNQRRCACLGQHVNTLAAQIIA